jgi:N-acetylglutamate synthase-like GNAT family acetyltransferase
MANCTDELTVDPGLRGHRFAVVEHGGVAAGLVELSAEGKLAELEKLFVDPAFFGRGIGRTLFEWAKREAVRMGAERLTVDSDPGARDFYLAMGAIEVGTSHSASIPGRVLPRLELDLRQKAP